MKKKVGEIYNKPIVVGNPNEFTKDEILIKKNSEGVSFYERGTDGTMKNICSSGSNGGNIIKENKTYYKISRFIEDSDFKLVLTEALPSKGIEYMYSIVDLVDSDIVSSKHLEDAGINTEVSYIQSPSRNFSLSYSTLMVVLGVSLSDKVYKFAGANPGWQSTNLKDLMDEYSTSTDTPYDESLFDKYITEITKEEYETLFKDRVTLLY